MSNILQKQKYKLLEEYTYIKKENFTKRIVLIKFIKKRFK